MRRTERLFAIIQRLRGRRAPVTAKALAEELEVSPRTVYRDVAELVLQRVPIRGEAGTGYVLDAGYDLPPLMLTPDELEAAMLGAAWVAQRGDPALARAARTFTEKLHDVVPAHLRPVWLDATSRPARPRSPRADGIDLAVVREAMRTGRKLELTYADGQRRETTRVVWPLVIGYTEDVRLVAAHCELRGGFRHFRADRILRARVLEARVPESLSSLRRRWREAFPGRE
jgi:predicted DNA-binding transcriptional regulator YafY